jgi:hypothetical protein
MLLFFIGFARAEKVVPELAAEVMPPVVVMPPVAVVNKHLALFGRHLHPLVVDGVSPKEIAHHHREPSAASHAAKEYAGKEK